VVVFSVDGDKAKFLAIRTILLKAIIVLCLYHSSINFKAKLGPLIRKGSAVPSTSEAESDNESNDVQKYCACQKCKKFRRIPVSHEIEDFNSCALEFVCDVLAGVTCEMDEDDSVQAFLNDSDIHKISDTIIEEKSTGRELESLNSDDVNTVYQKALISTMNWWQLWKYIRMAPTLSEVRHRLFRVVEFYPSSESYVNFLWTQVVTWAPCTHAWIFTSGLQVSSIQENIHSCLKVSPFRDCIPLLLNFFLFFK
jgi:hypothetical protein